MSVRPMRRISVAFAVGTVAALALAGCSGGAADDGGATKLTWYIGAGVPDDIETATQLAEAYNAKNPDVEITLDASGPEGVELDNAVKTKLSTDDMADIFWYNSGALMQALNPDQTLLNVGDAAFVDGLDDVYRGTVSTDAGTYGAPVGAAMGGGLFYNIEVFDELGLTVPTTWDEFMANNEKIKAADIAPVIQSYGDTWTSQMMVLADFYNVSVANPDFGEELTANEVTFAGEPAATASFEHLQELADAEYFNDDFASTTLDQAIGKLVEGEGAQYPMLTFAQATIEENYPDQADTIGFFAIPGQSAEDNGLTSWMPSSVYAPANTPHPEIVKDFMAFVASPEGCEAITEARGITGPYVVDGCDVAGADVSKIVSDLLPYFDEGNNSPALEFLSPVKGPNLQSLTVEVGSGIRDGVSAAKLYDEDNKLQAQQLGLPGW